MFVNVNRVGILAQNHLFVSVPNIKRGKKLYDIFSEPGELSLRKYVCSVFLTDSDIKQINNKKAHGHDRIPRTSKKRNIIGIKEFTGLENWDSSRYEARYYNHPVRQAACIYAITQDSEVGRGNDEGIK